MKWGLIDSKMNQILAGMYTIDFLGFYLTVEPDVGVSRS